MIDSQNDLMLDNDPYIWAALVSVFWFDERSEFISYPYCLNVPCFNQSELLKHLNNEKIVWILESMIFSKRRTMWWEKTTYIEILPWSFESWSYSKHDDRD